MGESKAERFERMMAEFERPVYLLCLRMMGSREDAQDCAQEAMLSAYRAFDRFRGEANVKTWLYRIAHNACIDALRARRKTVSLDTLREAGFDAPDPGAQRDYLHMETRERQEAVRASIARLPDDQREVLILRDLHDLSYDEIGEILRLPAGTVKSRLNRARERLKQIILSGGELCGDDCVQISEGRRGE